MKSDLPAILIVDDNEDNRYTLQMLLEADGHELIASASGGTEAMSLIEKQKFSLVLLDMMMPDMNGDEVLRMIKSNPDTRDIPVVMISADTDTDKISKCIELGADDYLPKPFNPTILRARIGSALRRESLRVLESEYVSKVEQEKRHSETLLRNILPPEIAIRLRNGESIIADHYEDATVLFADIVGFGKITARMKAYEIIGCLNQLFTEFDRLAEDVRRREDQDHRRQLHGGRGHSDTAAQSCARRDQARARHDQGSRTVALAPAGAILDPGGTAFRPGHGWGHRHEQVCL